LRILSALVTSVILRRLSMGWSKRLVPGMLGWVMFLVIFVLLLQLQILPCPYYVGHTLPYTCLSMWMTSLWWAPHQQLLITNTFALKDLGPFHYFLGIEVHPLGYGLLLCQRKYATELLQRAGLSKCAPVATPIVSFN
jgi:hypothetical protein